MTQNSGCPNLEAYLADDLTVGEVACFESHLDECAVCREAVDEQQWIDNLLQSPARIQIERTPAAILDSIRASVAHRDRWILRAAYGFAAAAVLLIGVGWVVLHRPAANSEARTAQAVAVVEEPHVPTHIRPKATFVATADAIVVPLESPSIEVTVVQVYPTTDTERRQRLEQTLLSASTISNGG